MEVRLKNEISRMRTLILLMLLGSIVFVSSDIEVTGKRMDWFILTIFHTRRELYQTGVPFDKTQS